MTIFLSGLPILSTLLALVLGMRSVYAALIGVVATVLAILLAFPIPIAHITTDLLRWTPLLTEVLLIVGGGLLLSEVLHQAGGQAVLAKWVHSWAGQGVGAVLLVVHGITPFAESLTGFGIGITIGIPLLSYFGLPAHKVALLGLLGLCAVPWGSMGPGTLIAATMSDLSFHDLGVASAVISVIPFVVTGVIAAWLASPPQDRMKALFQGALSGLLLTVAVTAANFAFGTAAAGAVGSLVMIMLHLLRGRQQRAIPTIERVGLKTLGSYAVLLGGVLVTGGLIKASGLSENWRYLGSPAIWLFIAALWFCKGLPKTYATQRAWASWCKVAPVAGLFIVLGILMAVSGIAAFLAKTLAGAGTAYLAAAPFVGALGGFITGSNTGANAMFATTQAEIAKSLGVSLLEFMAIHNVAAAFLLMASPGKVEMAIQLCQANAAQFRRWLQMAVLGIAFIVVAMLAVINVVLPLL